MGDINPKKGLIGIAARLVKCECLTELQEICENQKSVKTSVLQGVCDRIDNKLRIEAICVRNMANYIK